MLFVVWGSGLGKLWYDVLRELRCAVLKKLGCIMLGKWWTVLWKLYLLLRELRVLRVLG